MINLKITTDFRDVESRLAAMARTTNRLAPAFRELRKPMRDDQREHQRQQEGPDGKWKPRAPSTMAAIRRRKRRRLPRLLGRIPAAIKVKSDGKSVTAQPAVWWFAIHQHGGRAGRGAKIPARPFLWVSDALIAHASKVLRDAFLEAWRKG